MPDKKALVVYLLEFVDDQEEDAKMSAEEIKNHEDKERLDNLDLVTEKVKKAKKDKTNMDQCTNILTDVFSAIPM